MGKELQQADAKVKAEGTKHVKGMPVRTPPARKRAKQDRPERKY